MIESTIKMVPLVPTYHPERPNINEMLCHHFFTFHISLPGYQESSKLEGVVAKAASSEGYAEEFKFIFVFNKENINPEQCKLQLSSMSCNLTSDSIPHHLLPFPLITTAFRLPVGINVRGGYTCFTYTRDIRMNGSSECCFSSFGCIKI